MTQIETLNSLPTLANKNDYEDERPDSGWLWECHQLRLLIYRAMLRKLGSDEGRQIAVATDQLVGCNLLLKFIRDQKITAASALTNYVSSHKRQTVRDLGRQPVCSMFRLSRCSRRPVIGSWGICHWPVGQWSGATWSKGLTDFARNCTSASKAGPRLVKC